jgi:hypothetical protein
MAEKFALYKHYPPARVVKMDKRGRRLYLLLRWDNVMGGTHPPEKWVKAHRCEEYIPGGTQNKAKTELKPPYKVEPNWWQRIVIKLQNWYYAYRN